MSHGRIYYITEEQISSNEIPSADEMYGMINWSHTIRGIDYVDELDTRKERTWFLKEIGWDEIIPPELHTSRKITITEEMIDIAHNIRVYYDGYFVVPNLITADMREYFEDMSCEQLDTWLSALRPGVYYINEIYDFHW